MTMEMFLMGLCIGLFGLAVSAAAFGAATRQVDAAPPAPRKALPLPPSSFFIDAEARRAAPVAAPVDVLLLQLEQHIRLEQAAAEGFLSAPTSESLHGRTASPRAN
jgi:hypothetical protein